MLEEKLTKARSQNTRRNSLLLLGFFLSCCVGGGIFIALSEVDLGHQKEDASSVPLPVAKPHKESQKLIDTETREAFLKEMQQYETEIVPRLQRIDLSRWNERADAEIRSGKQQAMSNFSNGEYAEALKILKELKTRTSELLLESDAAFNSNLAKAASFFQGDRYQEAQRHIVKALEIYPQSQAALDLNKKIKKLAVIIPLLQNIEIARAENNLQKELAAIQQVLQIAPERDNLQHRLSELDGLIQEGLFKREINSGFTSLEKLNVEAARDHYKNAVKIDPARKELEILQSQLLATEKDIRFQTALDQAKQAVLRDDWVQAKIHYDQAARDSENNAAVIEGRGKATAIISLRTRIEHHINSPYRLTDEEVRQDAMGLLAQAKDLAAYSYSITRLSHQLGELLTVLNRLVSVTVTSDNNTFLQVRGVGKIGVVHQKNIELKPGTYTFEGSRKGYKSKLVRVQIPYDQENFSLHVICDEPI